MALLDLPTELLLLTAEYLGPRNLSALLRTSRALANLLTTLLHELGAQETYKTLLDAIDARETHTIPPTALYWAAHHGLHDLVLKLLDRGAALADITIPDHSTALHWAAKGGDEETTSLLLQRGAEYLNTPDLNTPDPSTALHWAVKGDNEETTSLLLQRGTEYLNTPDRIGDSPIFWAAEAGHEKIVRLLVSKGALLENLRGQHLLHNAITSKRPGIASVLLDKDSERAVRRHDQFGWLPLHCAARHGDETTLLRLLDFEAEVNAQHLSSGATALHWAAEGGHSRVIQILIARGAKLDARDRHCGATPFHWAAFCGNVGAAEVLLHQGADINAVCNDGNTALHLALHDNDTAHDELVGLLLRRTNGPDVNARNNRGDTPLRWPVFSGFHNSVERMLRGGADIFVLDDYGRTVLDCAQERLDVEMIKTLVRFGTRGMRQAGSVNWKSFWRVVPRLVKEPFDQRRRALPRTTTWEVGPSNWPCKPWLVIP